MKIGILTFHNIPNIGAILQAYALCVAFRNQGADCELIDYTCPNIAKRELRFRSTGNAVKDLILKLTVYPKTKSKIKACQQFMTDSQVYSPMCYTKDTLPCANNQYDAFISGSDMIWNLAITDHDWTYFCDFVSDDKKKYAYGSSIGGKWQCEDIDKVKQLLSRYSMIGVRESDTCEALNALGISACNVCDPTMLLRSADWAKIAVKPRENNYVLVYFSNAENIRAANEYAAKHNLKVLALNWGLLVRGARSVAPMTPQEWIGYFQHASAVFTGSFHGLLFSLYFNVPVWTDNQSNRVGSILRKLGIEPCLYKDAWNLDYRIDYSEVAEKIEAFRTQSLDYLLTIIKDIKG
jgi:hypothetical protein